MPGWASTVTSITRFTVKLGVRYISNETLPSDKINKKIFFLADCFLIDINSQFIFQTQRKPFLQHYQPPKTTSGRLVFERKNRNEMYSRRRENERQVGPTEDSPGRENTINTVWQPVIFAAHLTGLQRCVCVFLNTALLLPPVITQELCILFWGYLLPWGCRLLELQTRAAADNRRLYSYVLFLSFVRTCLQEKFSFLHIKPYNEGMYDHIQCSTVFCDEQRSPEIQSSLLTSPLAQNKRGA